MLFLSFMQSFDVLTPLKTTLIISQKEGKKNVGLLLSNPLFIL